ncbi:endolytic peptidoglycan transglycosylase RlpA [Acerihabitans sp. TG2]|uniref:endolytic peptidoglycan transglycosylase RlpA n=1 Tax=Acerihabitans sp. TG2 TaxID=3096008 RepID=UPI002B22776E|nr:endolytic peptidoglycan transglycosylase RlpA [Acerihabitans sp. TG2]MEA9392258.1 endolytic peptidoglycan transglycosylase RlpA [Acerihabitans sp. TG2]
MRKEWYWVGVMVLSLTACNTTENTPAQTTSAAPYNGPVVEISGVQPRYEPYNPATSQDYEVNGNTYHIVKDPQNFSQTGLASTYSSEISGNKTAIGETFDAGTLSAAHPTLPLPSYVRVTNLSNGRQLVVRVNDRGPYVPGRIIDLSSAAADRLNISNNTKVRVDFIQVAPDGTLSGPGTVGTVVAKQSYALPSRPTLDTGGMGTPELQSAPTPNSESVRPVADPSPQPSALDDDAAPVPAPSDTQTRRGGFLGAPSALPAGVIESSQPTTTVSQPPPSPAVVHATPAHTVPPTGVHSSPNRAVAPAVVASTAAVSASGHYMVQVGALGDKQRALTWQKTLSQHFGVPGKVSTNGSLFRVQLGPFASKQQASTLQQRLLSDKQQQSFITTATN